MEKKVLILGIGNLLWADEGFGIRALEYLQQHYQFDANVTLMDGGTQGIYLVQHIQACDILVVFDAVDYGLPGGTLKCVENQEVPKFLGAKKVSLHQTGFQEVLALAEMLGKYPQHLLLVGVQPIEIEDYGGSLRPQVKAQITVAIDKALDYLSQLGISSTLKQQRNIDNPTDGSFIANIHRYEQQRPSESQAYRYGDQRVLYSADFKTQYQAVPISDSPLSIGLDQHLDQYRRTEV